MSGYSIRVETESGRVGISKPGHYKTVRGAVCNFGRTFANGEACKIEVFHDARLLHLTAPWVLHFNAEFTRGN